MGTRTLGPGAGIGWLKNALNLGRDNPGAIFGGAALMILVLFAMLLPLILMMVPMARTNPDPRVLFGAMFAIGLPMMMVFAVMVVGFLRLIDAVETGRQVTATHIFAAFRDWPTALRAIGFMLLLFVIQNALLMALVTVFAPDFGAWYLHNLQASLSGHQQPVPAGFGRGFAIMLVVNLLVFAMKAVGLGQVALRGAGVINALKDAVSGAIKNVLPMLVFVLVAIGACLGVILVLGLLVGLLALLGKAIGIWILILTIIPLYLGLLLAMIVIMYGIMYYMWRDICGDAAAVPAGSADQLQA